MECKPETGKAEPAKVVSFSMSPEEEDRMNEYLTSSEYSNRSEFIRDAIRGQIRRKENLLDRDGEAEGVVMLLYRHSAGMKISDIRHQHMSDLVKFFSHADMERTGNMCCEVLYFAGDARRMRKFIDMIQAVSGVEGVEVFIV